MWRGQSDSETTIVRVANAEQDRKRHERVVTVVYSYFLSGQNWAQRFDEQDSLRTDVLLV